MSSRHTKMHVGIGALGRGFPFVVYNMVVVAAGREDLPSHLTS